MIGRTLAACVVGTWAALDAPMGAHRPGGTWHIVVEGDLDVMRLRDQLAEAVGEAEREDARAVVVEFTGDRARWDVAVAMGQVLASSKAPIWSLVRDEGSTVGLGQLVAANGAKGCLIGQRTGIAWVTGDDIRGFAPVWTGEGPSPEADAAAQFLARRVQARGGEAAVGAAMIASPVGTWLVSADPPKLIFSEHPPGPGPARLVSVAGDQVTVRVEVAHARALKLVDGDSAGVSEAFRVALGESVGGTRVKRKVASEFASATARAAELMASVERAWEEIDAALDDAEDATSDSRRRSQATRALEVISASEARLTGVERIAQEYPELALTPAPGRSELAQTTAKERQSAWKSLLDGARKKLASRRARAEGYASR